MSGLATSSFSPGQSRSTNPAISYRKYRYEAQLSAAVQPFFGQFSNLFGRRYLTLFIVSIYTLGSGICGGANSPTMLIAGRAVQGMGSGGINMIIDIIISDLVPLRDRGNYIVIILVIYGVGMAIGPFVGGVIV